MIVDDVDTREFLHFLLQQNGVLTTVAASATEALAAIVKTVADLLISDLGMPQMDGYSLIRVLRTMPKHVAKPVQPTELLNSIVDLLRQRYNSNFPV